MGKIMNIKTRKKRAPVAGFSYIYGAMMEYSDDFTSAEAMDICYDLYVAYTDSMRWDFPGTRFEEKRKKDFERSIRASSRRYQTSVQYYKALDFLLNHIVDACLQAKQHKTVQEMRRYVDEKAAFFHAATGVPLRSRSTVYHACAYGLLPAANEPKHIFANGPDRWRKML